MVAHSIIINPEDKTSVVYEFKHNKVKTEFFFPLKDSN